MPGKRKPRYLRVKEELAANIASGRFGAEGRLPPEEELAARLGISRATLREALRALEGEGLIRRHHGVGTFVNPRLPAIVYSLEVNLNISAAVRGSGLEPDTSDCTVREEPAGATTAARLELPAESPILRIERVRSVGGRPVIYTRDAVPRRLVPGPVPIRLDGSLYAFLEHACRQSIREGTARIEPLRADQRVSARLGISPGSILLQVQQVDRNQDGVPILFSVEYYVQDAFEFRVRRRRDLRADI